MTELLESVQEAVDAMNPIVRAWIIHAPSVTYALEMLAEDEGLSSEQNTALAASSREWAKLLADASMAWYDAADEFEKAA